MTFVRAADGTRLHYEVTGRGSGEPVLLIQGLGFDKRAWTFQRIALAPRYKTIAFDNRGTGRSDKPHRRTTIDEMADDAFAVLDAAGVRSAHVVGASMGGAIAQAMAVRHPERVRSLVLACTACRHHRWRRELLAEWASLAQEQGMREFARRNLRWLVGPRSLRRFWGARGLLGPLALSVPEHAFVAQIRAILDADDAARWKLRGLAMPTLVLVGGQDILTPMGDAEELHDLIAGSELIVIRGAAHGFFVEHASTFNDCLLDFLGRVTARSMGEGRQATSA